MTKNKKVDSEEGRVFSGEVGDRELFEEQRNIGGGVGMAGHTPHHFSSSVTSVIYVIFTNQLIKLKPLTLI